MICYTKQKVEMQKNAHTKYRTKIFRYFLFDFTNICVSLSKENNKQKTALWKNSNLVILMISALMLRAR